MQRVGANGRVTGHGAPIAMARLELMTKNNSNLLPQQQKLLPLLLDTELLSKLTGFAPQTLRHWATHTRTPPLGWPEPIRVGRNVRYRTDEIIRWINGGDRTSEIAPPIATEEQKRGRGRPRKGAPS